MGIWSVDRNGADISHLPPGWVRCDGQDIPEGSMWAGRSTPNLNGEKRFLRGGDDSNMLVMEDDQMQDHVHDVSDPGHSHYFAKYLTGMANVQNMAFPVDTDLPFNVDWYDMQTEHVSTGITVNGVASSYRHGAETRPKNMNVIYIIKIW